MKKVYNLTVNNFHTYFVGLSGVLGHNARCNLDEVNDILNTMGAFSLEVSKDNATLDVLFADNFKKIARVFNRLKDKGVKKLTMNSGRFENEDLEQKIRKKFENGENFLGGTITEGQNNYDVFIIKYEFN